MVLAPLWTISPSVKLLDGKVCVAPHVFVPLRSGIVAPLVPMLTVAEVPTVVVQPVELSERSAQTGRAWVGTPEVEILVRKLCATAASDSTPPNVDAVGLGRRAAPKVPEDILLALVVSVEQLVAALDRLAHANVEAAH